MASSRIHLPAPALAALLCVSMGPALARAGAEEDTTTYQEKARLIYSFARNSEWPKKRFATPETPFVIGIFGTDMISEYLRELTQSARLKDRPVQVLNINARAQLRACHVLFICRSEKDRLKPILAEVRHEGVLTIGECENFLAEGGMINFVNVEGTVGYQVKISNANDGNVTFRGQLLQYARRPPDPARSTTAGKGSNPGGSPDWR